MILEWLYIKHLLFLIVRVTVRRVIQFWVTAAIVIITRKVTLLPVLRIKIVGRFNAPNVVKLIQEIHLMAISAINS